MWLLNKVRMGAWCWRAKGYFIGALLTFLIMKGTWTPMRLFPYRCHGNDSSLDCLNHRGSRVQQDDPILIEILRTRIIIPPPPEDELTPAKTSNDRFDNVSDRLEKTIDIVKTFSPGFFVECGALDGRLGSNTLHLEKKLGWTGLLLEANPHDFAKMVAFRRNAWIVSLCLNGLPYPNKATFYLTPNKDRLRGVSSLTRREGEWYNPMIPTEIQCVPLFSLLLALKRTTIDYLSLDTEGAELDILKTIPFDKVTIKVLNVEFTLFAGGKEALENFLESKGFVFYTYAWNSQEYLKNVDSGVIFLHESLEFAQNLRKEINQAGVAAV